MVLSPDGSRERLRNWKRQHLVDPTGRRALADEDAVNRSLSWGERFDSPYLWCRAWTYWARVPRNILRRTGRSVHLETSGPGINERGPAKALYAEPFHGYAQLMSFEAKTEDFGV